MAADGVEETLKILEGRWKMLILFHLFAQPVLRFSQLERAIPKISQKMLIQQLRELERDGMVTRTVYPQVPPKVEYALTPIGRELCPALDALLEWGALRRRHAAGTAVPAAPAQAAPTRGDQAAAPARKTVEHRQQLLRIGRRV
jgi:DNA-binding HxlR family transcriptional regulator